MCCAVLCWSVLWVGDLEGLGYGDGDGYEYARWRGCSGQD